MVTIIVFSVLALGVFSLGMYVQNARQNARALKSVSKFQAACDKLEKAYDSRSEEDILRRKK